jgi:hypothetical protein
MEIKPSVIENLKVIAKNSSKRFFKVFLFLCLSFIFIHFIFNSRLTYAYPQPQTESFSIPLGNSIIVNCDKKAIQRVYIIGNITDANYTKGIDYPTNFFYFSTNRAGIYRIVLFFSYNEEYTIDLLLKTTLINSYFISGGNYSILIEAKYYEKSLTNSSLNNRILDDFVYWLYKLILDFPFWAKILYPILGIQFFYVGYAFIMYEEKRRKAENLLNLDKGNKIYLWTKVIYKFLLTSFIITSLIVGLESFLLLFQGSLNKDFSNVLKDAILLVIVAILAFFTYSLTIFFDKRLNLKPEE